jgi:hypothetical protein
VLCSAAETDLPWTDPELADDLLCDGLPHLRVPVTADAERVGPLVLPGRSARLWCLDRRQHERDPAWPGSPTGCACTIPWPAPRARSSRQVVDTPGTQEPLSIDAILELRSPDAVVTVLPVARHPLCGCGWTGATRTMVG